MSGEELQITPRPMRGSGAPSDSKRINFRLQFPSAMLKWQCMEGVGNIWSTGRCRLASVILKI